jgi:Beta protein
MPMLRDWESVPYFPIIGMRPAEMRALEELPSLTKDALLPMIPLRPWVGAHRLQSVIDRIDQSYGSRPVVVSVGDREPQKEREVYAELDRLRDPTNGFANWQEFIQNNENYIPVVQLGINADQEPEQIAGLSTLDRGIVLHLERPAFGILGQIVQIVAGHVAQQSSVCFVIDFGVARRDHLQVAAQTVIYIETIRAILPQAWICISASSFPSSFADLPEQEIYERRLFNEVARQIDGGKLIYGDRGSARAEQLSGGSGVIPARIDYPLFDIWRFYRSEDTGFSGYVEQANRLISSGNWNGDLRVWGTQMIERTARGDHSAIDTPAKSTAARINLHLQLQSFYNRQGDVEDTEEDWEG